MGSKKGSCTFFLLFLIFFLISCTSILAKREDAPIFKNTYRGMDVGGRAIGMGGAFVAISSDATSPYWNPAGLILLKEPLVNISFISEEKKKLGIDNIIDAPNQMWKGNFAYLSFASNRGAFSFRPLANFYKKDFLYKESDIKELEFKVSEYVVSIAEEAERSGIGINIKYINGKLGIAKEGDVNIDSGNGISFDLGMLYLLRKDIRFGLMVHNLWSKMYWYDYKTDSLTPNVKIGVSINRPNFLTVALDLEKILRKDEEVILHLGIESVFSPKKSEGLKSNDSKIASLYESLSKIFPGVVLRIGYMKNEDKAFTYGIGYIYRNRYQFDLAVIKKEKYSLIFSFSTPC